MRILAVVALCVACAAGARAGECRSCRFPYSTGSITCWGCGSHLPDAPMPADVLKLDLEPIRIIVAEVAAAAAAVAASPEVAYGEIDKWIRENPKNYDEALARLSELMATVTGTGFEAVVSKRIGEVKAAKADASRPRTPQERLKEAARAYTDVMGKIRKDPDRIVNNIKLLEGLMDVCKDTPYEQLVRKQIDTERAKASSR